MPGKQASHGGAFMSKVADPMKVSASPKVADATQVSKRIPPGTQKKKFCMYNLQGVCKYSGDQCSFAHSLEEMHQARKPVPNQTVNRKQDSPKWKDACPDDGLRNNRLRRGDTPVTSEIQQKEDWAQMVEPMFVKPLPLEEFQPRAGKVWTSETTAWTSEGLDLAPVPPLPYGYGPMPLLPPKLVGGTPRSGGTLPFGVPEPPGLSDARCARTLEWLTR
mmetsp:Transcript_18624/g.36514  ORF Transcript_18624/g.36514 Transcript_18624/m.36514 type:complete len:219 (-) Transcript_18624:128-784(-)